MIKLHENQVKFNYNILVSYTDGPLSSDSRLVLIKDLMNAFQFFELVQNILHVCENRAYFNHDNISILEQLIFQLITGYFADSSANVIKYDPFFQTIMGKDTLVSQS